ncbi:MAG: DapH/DapD/GlmU-related protein [Patescibacteria group bacterium]
MFKPEKYFDLENFKHSTIFKDINLVWEVLPKINSYILENIKPQNLGQLISTAYIDDNVEIGEGTIIEPNVVIIGPAIIGKNCHLRSSAYLRGNVIIGDNVVVGNSTEVKNSILFNNVNIPHFNYVGDSVLGYKAHLGAGVILSNTKTPPSPIKIQTLEKKYETNLIKFGAIIGDKTEIGCNAVMNPGTIIGKNCLVYPGTIFKGVSPHDAIIKSRQEQEVVIKLKK